MELHLTEEGKPKYQGFIKIWSSNSQTGEKKLLIDKSNTILNQGSDLLAFCLTGKPNSGISHLYLGYNNTPSFPGTGVNIDKTDPSMRIDANYGYLRIPLSYAPSFLKSEGYLNNIPVFSILLSNPASYIVGASPTFDDNSYMYEIALAAETVPGTPASDMVFSKADFGPLVYSQEHNLTISWGISFNS